jgi:hypothetical protein
MSKAVVKFDGLNLKQKENIGCIIQLIRNLKQPIVSYILGGENDCTSAIKAIQHELFETNLV